MLTIQYTTGIDTTKQIKYYCLKFIIFIFILYSPLKLQLPTSNSLVGKFKKRKSYKRKKSTSNTKFIRNPSILNKPLESRYPS